MILENLALAAVVVLAVAAARLAVRRPLVLDWDALFRAVIAGGSDAFEPREHLGPAGTWEDIARWSDGLRAALGRRLGGLRVVGGEWAELLASQVPGLMHVDALDAPLGSPSERILFVAEGQALMEGLQLLHDSPGLRDRIKGVVAVGGLPPDSGAWMSEHFTHEKMDTELFQALPYVALLTDDGQLPFAKPPVPKTDRDQIDAIALGPADADRVALCRALWIVLAHRLD